MQFMDLRRFGKLNFPPASRPGVLLEEEFRNRGQFSSFLRPDWLFRAHPAHSSIRQQAIIVQSHPRAFSIHMLTLHQCARWLFLKEKATPLLGFCKEQNRKRCSRKNKNAARVGHPFITPSVKITYRQSSWALARPSFIRASKSVCFLMKISLKARS